MVFLLLLGLLAAAPAGAQNPPHQWPIQSLTVQGNHNYSQEQILAVAGLKIGQMAGKQQFEAAQHRLEATGDFETVGYKFAPSPDGAGYVATFSVVEVEPVYPMRFADLGLPDREISQWLAAHHPLFAPKIPATKTILERYARSVEELLAARQHPEKVIAKLEPTGPDQFVIVFRPNRPEAAVAEVSFQGNQVVPANLLQDAIGGVAVGAIYTEAGFRELLNSAVKPLYDARGRIRVSFPKITAEKLHTVEGVAVHVTVDEGPSFALGEITLDNHSVVKTEDLLKAANFKKGDLANFDEINHGTERIRTRLHRDGYMRAASSVERNIHDDKKTVDVVVHIQEGPQFSFGQLTVQGLDLDGEAAIRKMWTMQRGKPFNPDYPDYFLSQVKERGLFDNLGVTKSTVQVNEQTRTVDVTLSFQGPTKPAAASPEQPRSPYP